MNDATTQLKRPKSSTAASMDCELLSELLPENIPVLVDHVLVDQPEVEIPVLTPNQALLSEHQAYLTKQAEMLTQHMIQKKLPMIHAQVEKAVNKQMEVVVKRLTQKLQQQAARDSTRH